MTTETKVRKNTDYSASAVNLFNPQEIEIKLCELHSLNSAIELKQSAMDALIPQVMKDEMGILQKQLAELTQTIRENINSLGSYQNLEQGWYGVKQRKVSMSYDANRFEFCYPQLAPLVIEKTVNQKKIDGLIKGGFVSIEQMKDDEHRVIKESESFAYIIKA